MIDEDDLRLNTIILRKVRETMEPYARDVENVQRDVADIKRDAERSARYADDDRKRLVDSLKDEAEKIAEDVAEKAVTRILERFGLDPQKPDDFRKLVDWLNELKTTVHDARKHGITVIVGVVAMGLATLIWKAVTMGGIKP